VETAKIVSSASRFLSAHALEDDQRALRHYQRFKFKHVALFGTGEMDDDIGSDPTHR
jgi:hypothetical protein